HADGQLVTDAAEGVEQGPTAGPARRAAPRSRTGSARRAAPGAPVRLPAATVPVAAALLARALGPGRVPGPVAARVGEALDTGHLVAVDHQRVVLTLDQVGAFGHRLGHVRVSDHPDRPERRHQADALDALGPDRGPLL